MKARKIELKSLPTDDELGVLPSGSMGGELVYSEIIKGALKNFAAPGVTGEDVVRVFDILDALKQSNGALHLSPADYDWLKPKIEDLKWVIPTRAAMEFLKDFREAETVELPE